MLDYNAGEPIASVLNFKTLISPGGFKWLARIFHEGE
jgi:hypothetical protein